MSAPLGTERTDTAVTDVAVDDAFDCDVAVIGLGPVGAMLVNLLDEAGLSVIGFDREPDIMPIPRGVGIDAEIMRVMQTLGLAEELEPQLKVFRGAQYLDVDGNVVSTRPGITREGPQSWPARYNVHQPDFERVLRNGIERRDGASLRLSHEVTGFEQDAASATVVAENFTDGSTVRVRARFVVGCDGGRSIARRFASTELDDYGLNEPWIVADFAVDDEADLPGINTHYADPVQPAIYIHVVRDLRRFEFKARPGEDLAAAVEPDALWQRVSRWITPEHAELLRAAVYTHRSLVAKDWRHGRLLLAGDAAHQTPPFLGQGLCTGVRDAASLAWRLGSIVRDEAPISLLDSYVSERAEHARFFIRTATKLGAQLSSPDKSKLDELNRQVGREGSGSAPRLGEGLFVTDAVGGTLAPQPRTASGARLDDAVGYRFAIVAEPALHAELDAATLRLIAEGDLALVEADGPLLEWLEVLGARAAILRPDRYYYGAFTAAEEVAAAVRTIVAGIRPKVIAGAVADA